MATSSPLDGSPSLRGVRDKYLALLLSNGQPAPTAPPPPPSPSPQPLWTPGQKLGYQDRSVQWTSPVTPAPTESDVRLAEIAAGLVAAGGHEQRQADAIRRLTDELEKSERRIRHFEQRKTTVGNAGGLENGQGKNRRVSYGEAKRSIHFTPRTPRRSSTGRERDREERWQSTRFEKSLGRRQSGEFVKELEELRQQRVHWVIDKERSEQEAARLSVMLADIRKNTQRLLSERDDHLKAIARLQDQVSKIQEAPSSAVEDGRGPVPCSPPRNKHPEEQKSPIPLFCRRYSSNDDFTGRQRVVGTHPPDFEDDDLQEFQGNNEVEAQLSAAGRARIIDVNKSPQRSMDRQDPSLRSAREEELQKELRLVLDENAKLSERIISLEGERLEATQNENSESSRRQETRVASAEIDVEPSDSVIQQLVSLLEEVHVLEGVSDAMHFEITPCEADLAQDDTTPFTGLQSATEEHTLDRVRESVHGQSVPHARILKDVAARIVRIRESLSVKYGKWLEAIANDVTDTHEQTLGAPIAAEEDTVDYIEGDMNTEVINKLME